MRAIGLKFLRRDPPLSGAIVAHALAWVAFLWLALWPFSYRGVTVTPAVTPVPSGSGNVAVTTYTSASFIEANGWWVLIPLFVPVALSGLALVVVLWFAGANSLPKRFMLFGLTIACLVFCLLGYLSIGILFLPAALAMLVTAFLSLYQTRRQGRRGRETVS